MPRGVSMHFTWTPDRDARLRELWESKQYNARTIASMISEGLTKNAVIGRAHRLGLSKKRKARA